MVDWRENPLVRRELLLRLRPQTSHRRIVLVVLMLGLVATALLYWSALETFQGYDAPRNLLAITLTLVMLATIAGAPAATANAISREREQRTWDLLTITLLQPHEVVLGKLIGRIIPLTLLLVPSAPMMLLCVIFRPNLLLSAILGTLCVLVTLVFYSTAGLAASCFSRKTVTATALAYLFAGGWVVGTFILWGLTSMLFPSIANTEATWWLTLNPVAVIEPLMNKYAPQQYATVRTDPLAVFSPWVLLFVYSGLTVLLIWMLIRTYRHWAYR